MDAEDVKNVLLAQQWEEFKAGSRKFFRMKIALSSRLANAEEVIGGIMARQDQFEGLFEDAENNGWAD